jgi:hypothetical protein
MQELKKPLRVTFLSEDGRVPEEGVDQGGVSREFFQLLVAQLFNPDYGMFLYVQESRVCWFNPASMESLVRRFVKPTQPVARCATVIGHLNCCVAVSCCWSCVSRRAACSCT